MSISLNNSGYNPHNNLTRGISSTSQADVYRGQVLGKAFYFNASKVERSLEVMSNILFTRCETKPPAARATCEKLQAKAFQHLANRVARGAVIPGLEYTPITNRWNSIPKLVLTPDNLFFGKSYQA